MPVYNNIAKIRIAPIEHIKLYYPSAPSSPLFSIYNLESGSVFSIAAIEADNDQGGTTIVAWELNITAIMAENDYATKADMVSAVAGYKLSDVDLRLKPLSGQPNGAEVNISCDSGSVGVIAYSANIALEYVDGRGPRGVIRIKGLWSVDAFGTSDFTSVYQQIAGFS